LDEPKTLLKNPCFCSFGGGCVEVEGYALRIVATVGLGAGPLAGGVLLVVAEYCTNCLAWSRISLVKGALLFAFFKLFPAVDLILFLRDGAGFCLLRFGDIDCTSGEIGSEGRRGPAGIVGVGAASKAV
jgi:hypothetical protein